MNGQEEPELLKQKKIQELFTNFSEINWLKDSE